MILKIQHDREQESIEAKTRWFKSLSMADRMEVFCNFTDMALSANPKLQGQNHAKPIAGRIQILSEK